MRWSSGRRAGVVAVLLAAMSGSPALAGNLTFPVADPRPRVTAWMDHHYPTRQADGVMIRFDGATEYPYDGHRGTDYAVNANTPVVAADDGVVIYAEWSDSGGWGVVIDHAENRTAYFHNNVLYVYPGQRVNRGQLISLSGSTGNSTGPHLHFEVRDLLWPWHAVDPYGWTGPGPDPWHWDMGYLWTTDPPTPFLLPLAFVGGARWNSWYGLDGAPPPVTWSIRDGTRGFGGYAVQWDAEPGVSAPRTAARQGATALPGPGSHTLHLRVFDAAGGSADISYLYLYDVGRPSAELRADARSGTVALDWTGRDDLSGVRQAAIEVTQGGVARRWAVKAIDGPSAGTARGALRFFGEPGNTYEFRLTLRNGARNPSPPALERITIPATGGRPAVAADQAVLGALPDFPPGMSEPLGLRQEHPMRGGARCSWGRRRCARPGRVPNARTPPGANPPIDVVMDQGNLLVLLADGTVWSSTTEAPVSRPRMAAAGRLLNGSGGLVVAGARGVTVSDRPVELSPALAEGVTLVDAAVFSRGGGGLALDSDGQLHAFGVSATALTPAPAVWPLPDLPAGVALAGSANAPAGLLFDARGRRQPFGSVLLLPDSLFRGPTFDPVTGLVVR